MFHTSFAVNGIHAAGSCVGYRQVFSSFVEDAIKMSRPFFHAYIVGLYLLSWADCDVRVIYDINETFIFITCNRDPVAVYEDLGAILTLANGRG